MPENAIVGQAASSDGEEYEQYWIYRRVGRPYDKRNETSKNGEKENVQAFARRHNMATKDKEDFLVFSLP